MSSDSQEFSQGSNYSDTSDVGIKRELLKIEISNKTEKLELIQQFFGDLQVPPIYQNLLSKKV